MLMKDTFYIQKYEEYETSKGGSYIKLFGLLSFDEEVYKVTMKYDLDNMEYTDSLGRKKTYDNGNLLSYLENIVSMPGVAVDENTAFSIKDEFDDIEISIYGQGGAFFIADGNDRGFYTNIFDNTQVTVSDINKIKLAGAGEITKEVASLFTEKYLKH